jgi:hypothetical protein
MTLDEALLIVKANAPAIIEDLFKPCTCEKPDLKPGEVSFDLYFGSPKNLTRKPDCSRCQARRILTFLIALSDGMQEQEPLLVPFFTSIVQELPS